MTPERFADLLDRRGPALARWPAADRAAAETLLADSPAARAALAKARALDAALRRALPHPDPAALARLQDRIARSIARAPLPAPPGLLARLRAALHPAAPAGWGALVAVATCALWLGLAGVPRAAVDPLGPLLTLPLAGESL
jgi:anti-sigma factor RsiW